MEPVISWYLLFLRIFTDRHCVPPTVRHFTPEKPGADYLPMVRIKAKFAPAVEPIGRPFSWRHVVLNAFLLAAEFQHLPELSILSRDNELPIEKEEPSCRDPINGRVHIDPIRCKIYFSNQVWPRGSDHTDLAVISCEQSPAYMLPASFDDVRLCFRQILYSPRDRRCCWNRRCQYAL